MRGSRQVAVLVGMLWIEAAFSYIPRSEGGHFLPLGEARDLLLAHGISFLAQKLEVRLHRRLLFFK